jgi:MFS family permease
MRRRFVAQNLYYGWFVVGACFIAIFCTYGVVYSFGVYFEVVLEEFALPRWTTSLAFSLQSFVLSVVGAIAGVLVGRFRTRTFLSLGMVLFTLGLYGASFSGSIGWFLLTYGVTTGAGGGLLFVVAYTTIPRWFDRRRGLAMGITTMGFGFGMLVCPPIATYLIGTIGWQSALAVLASGFLFVLLLAVGLFAEHPGVLDVDTSSEGLENEPSSPVSLQSQLEEVLSIGRSPVFRACFFGWVCIFSTMYVLFSHLPAHATDLGLDRWIGTWAISIVGVIGIVARLAFGPLSDRFGPVRTFVVGASLMAVAPLCLPFADSSMAVYLAAGIFGAGYGGVDALLSPLIADLFGSSITYASFGLMSLTFAVSGLVFPPLAGYTHDVAGSYTPVFVLVGVLGIVGIYLGYVVLDHFDAGIDLLSYL